MYNKNQKLKKVSESKISRKNWKVEHDFIFFCRWRYPDDSFVNFEQILHIALVFRLFILNIITA